MQAWGFANILFEPGEEFWQLVGQNAIWHIHDYSAQNIANGEDLHLCTIFAVHDVCLSCSPTAPKVHATSFLDLHQAQAG